MSHPDAENLGAPPRDVPRVLRVPLSFGEAGSQAGWIWAAFSSILVWSFLPESEVFSWITFAGPRETAVGRVSGSEATRHTEGGRKGRPGTPIFANHYTFGARDVRYVGCSYAVGRRLEAGAAVTVEYLVADPSISRIQGLRYRVYDWTVAFSLLLPLVGLGMAVPRLVFGRRARRLLACGRLAWGRLRSRRPAKIRMNRKRVFILTFEFAAEDGRTYEAVLRTDEIENLVDEAKEQILYDPDDPSCALPLDTLPRSFRVEPDGRLIVIRPLASLAWGIAPFLTLAGNLAWAAGRYLT